MVMCDLQHLRKRDHTCCPHYQGFWRTSSTITAHPWLNMPKGLIHPSVVQGFSLVFGCCPAPYKYTGLLVLHCPFSLKPLLLAHLPPPFCSQLMFSSIPANWVEVCLKKWGSERAGKIASQFILGRVAVLWQLRTQWAAHQSNLNNVSQGKSGNKMSQSDITLGDFRTNDSIGAVRPTFLSGPTI